MANGDGPQSLGVIDPSLMAPEDEDDDDDENDDDDDDRMELDARESGLVRRASDNHTNTLSQNKASMDNSRDLRMPVSQAMSISAMLSNPVVTAAPSTAASEKTAVPVKATRTKTPRRKISDDATPVRKAKGKASVSSSPQFSR